MALQLQDLLMRLQPPSAQNWDPGSDKSIQRQQLELARQQFEEVKRKNAEDAELRKMADASEMRRAELMVQKEREQAAAQAAAKSLEVRQGALADFAKYQDSGDFEGMGVAATRLNALGGYARRLDAGGGFPAWQVGLEPPKTPPGLNPIDALGYGTLGTPDSLPETEKGAADPLSTEEAFARAGSVPTDQTAAPPGADPTTDAPDALTSENLQPGGAATDAAPAAMPAQAAPREIQGLTPGMTSFAPRRPPDAPDMTGGVTNDVPNDVVNTAALQYQRQQRLGPVMAGIAQSYPAAYRDNMAQANDAIAASGLPVDKALERAQSVRSEVAGAIEHERGHEFKLQEEEAKAAAPLKRTEEQEIVQKGFKRSEASFKDKKIQDSIATFTIADEIERMLTSGDPLGQDRAINLLGQLNAQSKQQSDADADRLTGLDRASFVEKVNQYIYQITNSGFNEHVKASMLEFAHSMRERNKTITMDWMESNLKQADSNKEPLVGRGYREFLESTIPQDLMQEYDRAAGDAPEAAPQNGAPPQEPGQPAGGGDYNDVLEQEAGAHGLDTGAIRRVLGGESGGDPKAASKKSSARGLGQFMDATAQRYDNPHTGKKFANAAEYGQLSGPEQVPALVQEFVRAGVNKNSPPEDYALALAAPAFVGKSANRDQVVYPKGTADWEANEPWRPAGGGDITVGSIVDYYFGKKKDAPAKQASAGKGKDDAKLLEGI